MQPCNSSSGCQLREMFLDHLIIIISLQTRGPRLGTRVTRTLCGATSRERAWGAATSATPTTTSPPSTSPSTPPAPTTSSVSHRHDRDIWASCQYAHQREWCQSPATYISRDIKCLCDAIGPIVHLIAGGHIWSQWGQISQIAVLFQLFI